MNLFCVILQLSMDIRVSSLLCISLHKYHPAASSYSIGGHVNPLVNLSSS